MPLLPTNSDAMRCPTPGCNGIAIIEEGSHNTHGKFEWWVRRSRVCHECGTTFETEETIRPGTLQKPLLFDRNPIYRTNIEPACENVMNSD